MCSDESHEAMKRLDKGHSRSCDTQEGGSCDCGFDAFLYEWAEKGITLAGPLPSQRPDPERAVRAIYNNFTVVTGEHVAGTPQRIVSVVLAAHQANTQRLDLENPERQEQDEYRSRCSRNECTCDLLTPFGHVTCPACNNMPPEELAEHDEIELQLEYGW